MLLSVKKSFDSGIEKIKWFSSVVTERVKVEMAVIKLLRESDDLEKKKDELMKDIGERVFELRGRSEPDLLNDSRIKRYLKEVEALEGKLNDLKSKVSETEKADI